MLLLLLLMLFYVVVVHGARAYCVIVPGFRACCVFLPDAHACCVLTPGSPACCVLVPGGAEGLLSDPVTTEPPFVMPLLPTSRAKHVWRYLTQGIPYKMCLCLDLKVVVYYYTVH